MDPKSRTRSVSISSSAASKLRVALTPEQLKAQEARAAKENYVVRDLVALDEGLNVVTGGTPDETISSRCSREASKHWWARWILRGLDLIQRNHGPRAQAGDLERAEKVAKIEQNSGTLE